MKVLLAHTVPRAGAQAWYAAVAAAAPDGLSVRTFPVTLDPPGPALSWAQLDRMWGLRSPSLLAMSRRLVEAAADCDVLLVYNGANVHPELLPHLPTFNVYGCFDDPESSEALSRPVAARFDAAFFGNVASEFQYRHWGCRRLAHLPVFTAPGEVPPRGEGGTLLAGTRDVDVVLACERTSPWRRARLEALAGAFPEARCHGEGWPAGPLPAEALDALYRRARIGWNVHNSTGPINRRTFALAGYGALQICDNKTGLGRLFVLGKEAVGFDTIPEAVELTRHYLAHEDERAAIARAGWERYWRDYHPAALWGRIRDQLERWGAARRPAPRGSRIASLPAPGEAASTFAAVAKRRLRPWVHAARAGRDGARRTLVPAPTGHDERAALGESVPAYRENPEMHGVNWAERRLAAGEPQDWPNILALNWAVAGRIGRARSIVEIGSGTGPFAEYASIDPARTIDAFEEDDFARGVAERERVRPNVRYRKSLDGMRPGGWDLLVSIEVIEHVDDLPSFLRLCASLAPRAIFTTPNRAVVRGPSDVGPPVYPAHVREFDPGELYWLLRQHWRHVDLFHLPDVYVPWLVPMDLATAGTPIIAECREPLTAAPPPTA